MYEKFTDRARRVLVLAQQAARDGRHDEITPDHILVGCLEEHDGVAGRVLDAFAITAHDARRRLEQVVPRRSVLSPVEAAASVGVDLVQVKEAVEEAFGAGSFQLPGEQPPFARSARDVLTASVDASVEWGHNYIGTEHLLLGLLGVEGGEAAASLTAVGVDPDAVRQLARTVMHRSAVVERQPNRERARDMRRGVQRLPSEVNAAARAVLNETVNTPPGMPLIADDTDFETWLSQSEAQLGAVVDQARARLTSLGMIGFVDTVAALMKTETALQLHAVLEKLRDKRDELNASDGDDEATVNALAAAVRHERRASEVVDQLWTSIWNHPDDRAHEDVLKRMADALSAISHLR